MCLLFPSASPRSYDLSMAWEEKRSLAVSLGLGSSVARFRRLVSGARKPFHAAVQPSRGGDRFECHGQDPWAATMWDEPSLSVWRLRSQRRPWFNPNRLTA